MKDLPRDFVTFYKYVKTLKFTDPPDYSYMRYGDEVTNFYQKRKIISTINTKIVLKGIVQELYDFPEFVGGQCV